MKRIFQQFAVISFSAAFLTACGGGSGSDNKNKVAVKPAPFSISASAPSSQVTESSAFALSVTSNNASGNVALTVEFASATVDESLVSVNVSGETVQVEVADLEKSGDFNLTVTATDSAGKSDSTTMSFNVENTSVQPILDELEAYRENKWQIANFDTEREVLRRIAKVAFYAGGNFEQSDLEQALSKAGESKADAERDPLLEQLEVAFNNTDFTESELVEKLNTLKFVTVEYLADINNTIFEIAQRTNGLIPEMQLNGLYFENGSLSQFKGNPLFSGVSGDSEWARGYEFLGSIISGDIASCNQGA